MGSICVTCRSQEPRLSIQQEQLEELKYGSFDAPPQDQEVDLAQPIITEQQADIVSQTFTTLQSEETFQKLLSHEPLDLPPLEEVVQIELCLTMVKELHSNEVYVNTRHQEFSQFVRRLHSLVYVYLEQHLRSLSLSQQCLEDKRLLLNTIEGLVTLTHVIEHIQQRSEAWWTEERLQIQVEQIQEQPYIVQLQKPIEQKLIGLSGMLKRELYTFHRPAARYSQMKYQKDCFFKHKVDRLREKAQMISEENKQAITSKTSQNSNSGACTTIRNPDNN